jgi:hypothetical protein
MDEILEAQGFISPPRPVGIVLFDALSVDEQEKAIGVEAAELVRAGEPLESFVGHSSLETDQPNFITQKPVQDVA